jgi:engulfment and cell motility protein 1
MFGKQSSYVFRGISGKPSTAGSSQRLMSSHTIEDLTSCILDFQANMVSVNYRKKTTLVEPEVEPLHEAALKYIWRFAGLQEEDDVLPGAEPGAKIKWRQLGFDTENMSHEFGEVGVLGLDCLVRTLEEF